MLKLFQTHQENVPKLKNENDRISPIKELKEPVRFSQEVLERDGRPTPSGREMVFGIVVLFIGAFAVSYLMMPASFAKSGIVWATITLVYSGCINYYSVRTILDICRARWIDNYFDFYVTILGEKFGFLVFLLFILNAFVITFSTLMSLNKMISNLLIHIVGPGHILGREESCIWAVVVTVVMTPFVYKSSTESLSIVSGLTGVSIISSLVVVGATCFQEFKEGGVPDGISYFDPTGTIYSFNVSFFSFLIQLNVFDLFTFFEGSKYERVEKIQKSAFWVNFVIFMPYFFIGIIFFIFIFKIKINFGFGVF